MSKDEHIAGKLAERLSQVAEECRGYFVVGPPPQDVLEGWMLSEAAACQQAVMSGDGTTIWTTGEIDGVLHRLERQGHRVMKGGYGKWHCLLLRLGHTALASYPIEEA